MGITFSATDIRATLDESSVVEYLWNLGKALADWLPEEGSVAAVKGVGASEQAVHALTEGLLLQGRDVVDAGSGDQAAAVAAVSTAQAAGGIYIGHDDLSGSEVLAFYDARGVIIAADTGLIEISQLAESGNFVPASQKGEVANLS